MKLSLVVAMSRSGLIGSAGGLPWRLPRDLKHFRRLTWGKPIIMGRKTHEALGRPLPGRTNIVLTRQADFQAPGCLVAGDRDQAIALAEATGSRGGDDHRRQPGLPGVPAAEPDPARHPGRGRLRRRRVLPVAGDRLARLAHDLPGTLAGRRQTTRTMRLI